MGFYLIFLFTSDRLIRRLPLFFIYIGHSLPPVIRFGHRVNGAVSSSQVIDDPIIPIDSCDDNATLELRRIDTHATKDDASLYWRSKMPDHDRLLPAEWAPASDGEAHVPPPPIILPPDYQTRPHLEIYRGIRAILDNLEALAKRVDAKITDFNRTAR